MIRGLSFLICNFKFEIGGLRFIIGSTIGGIGGFQLQFGFKRIGMELRIKSKPSAGTLHESRFTNHKNEPSKGFGKRADMRWRSTWPFKFARITSASPQNSHRIWRHDPHGGVSASVSVTTATASNPRSPSEIALKMATRSAHSVNPYVAFSTLQPLNILPDLARTAAPTRKLEYGAWACSRAVLAAAISESCSLISHVLVHPRNHGAQQRNKVRLHALARLEHFLRRNGLVENSRGHVRDARYPQDANSHVRSGDHFRYRGHSHEVRSDRTQITNLGRRFVTGACERRVYAL